MKTFQEWVIENHPEIDLDEQLMDRLKRMGRKAALPLAMGLGALGASGAQGADDTTYVPGPSAQAPYASDAEFFKVWPHMRDTSADPPQYASDDEFHKAWPNLKKDLAQIKADKIAKANAPPPKKVKRRKHRRRGMF